MEEDIKILKNTLEKYCYKNCKGEIDDSCKECGCKRLSAIENLIKGYREKEESEQYLYDAYQDAGKIMFEYAEKCDELEKENQSYRDYFGEPPCYDNASYIPKSKVKEKIEELKAMSISEDIYYEDILNLLQELMEDK